MKTLPFLLAALFLGAVSVAHAQQSANAKRAPMKNLLAQGFEIRSHQFFRCKADDALMSCVNVVMQKGKQFASCEFDRSFWLYGGGSVEIECALFQ